MGSEQVMKQIGKHLRAIRNEKGVVVPSLEEKSGWSTDAIYALEKGKNMKLNLPMLCNVLDAMGATPDDFRRVFTFTDEEVEEWEL